MPIIPLETKASTDSYPFYFDYSGWPQLEDDDIASAVVTATPSGLTIGTPTVSVDNDNGIERVYVTVGSGVDGITYRLTCVATTTLGSTLTGFLSLAVSDEDVSGIIVYPSQLLPYMDNRRVMELLYDEEELVNATTGAALPVPSANTIDGNARAHSIAARAWATLMSAVRRGNTYREQEMIDLVYDPIRGQMAIEVLANIFWCSLLKRRRYVTDEPQGKDPACQEAETALEQLRTGNRIFVLDGVQVHDSDGNATGDTYGNPLGDATTMSTGSLGSDLTGCCRADRAFWGCTSLCRPPLRPRRGNSNGCC